MTARTAPRGDDHEAPWLASYPAGVPATYSYPAVEAGRLLDDAAADFPDAIAIEYRRYRLSYRKLADHADRLATALASMGVGPGAGVVILLPNCPQLVIALFATWRLGGRVTLLTPERAGELVTVDPRVVIVMDRWYGRCVAPHRAALGPRSGIVATGVGDYLPFPDNVAVPVRRLLRGGPSARRVGEGVLGFANLVRRNLPHPEEPPDAATLPALSAPTGDLTQRQLVVNSFQLRLWMPDMVAGDERVLLGLPLASSLGALWVLTSVLTAATMILVDDRRPAVRQRLAVRARPTILPLDDELGGQLLRPTRRRSTIGSVRIAIAGDALSPQRRHLLEDLTDKGRVRCAWGIHGLLTHADPVYGRHEEGTVGLPLPDTDVVIVEAAEPARHAPTGTRGRLRVRGPQLRGRDWVDAGVEATLRHDGYLVVHDR